MEAVQQATEDHIVQIPRTGRALDITVLMGGPSTERDVSLDSGRAIADALERVGHRVSRDDILPTDTRALDREGVDVVFIALHGEFGEDGHVQALCEDRGLAYIGSGPRASELAMDKAAAKQVFRREGLATPDWIIVEEYDDPAEGAERVAAMDMPVVVKPVSGGSSVDVTIARDADARDRAMENLLDTYSRAMIEQFIDGRELTVGILGGQVLPIIEIVPPEEFYDKAAKYTDCGTQYVFDHGLDAGAVRATQAAALATHDALGCRDLSRADIMLDAAGTPWVLEVNTIPGFTSHSLLPMAAARVGISFDQLVDGIAAMALARHEAE